MELTFPIGFTTIPSSWTLSSSVVRGWRVSAPACPFLFSGGTDGLLFSAVGSSRGNDLGFASSSFFDDFPFFCWRKMAEATTTVATTAIDTVLNVLFLDAIFCFWSEKNRNANEIFDGSDVSLEWVAEIIAQLQVKVKSDPHFYTKKRSTEWYSAMGALLCLVSR